MSDYMKSWVRAAGIRAIKTAAQTALSLVSVGQIVTEVPWQVMVSAAIVAGVYSLLTSVAGLPEVNEE